MRRELYLISQVRADCSHPLVPKFFLKSGAFVCSNSFVRYFHTMSFFWGGQLIIFMEDVCLLKLPREPYKAQIFKR